MDILEIIEKMQEMYGDDVITTADKINRPEPKKEVQEIEAINAFMKRNPKAGGGMLVKPSVDGSRPGYAKKDIITFEVFTDGSSIGNGSKNALGGIGAYFYNGHGLSNVSLNYYKFIKENKNYQGEKATNNVTELLAIMIAIQLINEKFKKLIELETNKGKTHRIIIYSDSEYAINCVTKWAINWQRNGWQKKTGGNLRGNQIKNLEIIKRIYGAYTSQRIKFVHVNSHLREPKNKNSVEWKLWHGNDMADRLARAGAIAS